MGQVNLVIRLGRLLAAVGIDLLRFVVLSFRSRTALAAENLFLRNSWRRTASGR